MGEWTKVVIEDLSDKELGHLSFVDGDWIESEHIIHEGIRIIQTGNIGIGKYLDKPGNKKFISQNSFTQLKCKKVFPGDLLICRLAEPIGRVCIVPNNEDYYVTAVDVIIFRPSQKFSKNFLLHYLNDERILKLVNDQSGGSTRQRISRTNYGKLEIKIPDSLSEQTIIATILTTIDQSIEKTEQLIAKYERIKTGLMQDLLTRGIDEQGNIRSEEAHEFELTRAYKHPKEWKVVKLRTYLENIEQGWSPNCASENASPFEWGVLKTSSITWEGFKEYENKKLPSHIEPKKRYEIKNEDVLITRAGPNSRVGVITYVEKTRSKLILSDKIYRLLPNNKLIPKYLALALSSQFTQKHLEGFKTGMAESQTNISQEIVKDLEILLPEVDEQRLIVNRLDAVENSIVKIRDELTKLNSIKTALMQDLLTGKVRVDALIL